MCPYDRYSRIWPDSKPGTITFFADDPKLNRFTADRNEDDSAPWHEDELSMEGFIERRQRGYVRVEATHTRVRAVLHGAHDFPVLIYDRPVGR